MCTLSLAEKKKYLQAYMAIRRELEILEEEILHFRQAKAAPSQVIHAVPGNRSYEDYSLYASLLEQKIEKLQRQRLAQIERYQDILDCIECLSDETERDVLRLKYIHGYTLEKTAEYMHYSLRQINNIHRKALEHLRPERIRAANTPDEENRQI